MKPRFTFASSRSTVTICAFLLCIALLPTEASAQRPGKVHQIGYLITGEQAAWANRIEAMRAGLRDLGYVEGKNLTIIFRSGTTAERLPEAVAELVRLNVDVIFATSSTEVGAARQATKTITIVFATHADPVGVGHVASLRRPGGNATGLSMLLTELTAKELEILRETLPHMQRVGALLTPWAPSHVPASQMLEAAAKKLVVRLVTTPVQTAADFDGALTLMAREGVNGFVAVSSPLIRSQPAILAELALKHQLPAIFAASENVDAGGLMSYAPDLVDLTRRAAIYIDKILKGCEAGRSTGRASLEVRARHQPENRQSARRDDSARHHDPCGSCDPMNGCVSAGCAVACSDPHSAGRARRPDGQ